MEKDKEQNPTKNKVPIAPPGLFHRISITHPPPPSPPHDPLGPLDPLCLSILLFNRLQPHMAHGWPFHFHDVFLTHQIRGKSPELMCMHLAMIMSGSTRIKPQAEILADSGHRLDPFVLDLSGPE